MTRSVRSLMAIAVILSAVLAGCVQPAGAPPAAQDPSAPQPSNMPSIPPDVAASAAAAAAEEFKALPSGAVQVDCAPGWPTYPPYTRLTGTPSTDQVEILSDGRCFRVPSK